VEQQLRADLGVQLESIIPAEILVHWEERLIDARLQKVRTRWYGCHAIFSAPFAADLSAVVDLQPHLYRTPAIEISSS
jgi:hypothetical protein